MTETTTEIKIEGMCGDWTVDGVPGNFKFKRVRGFNQVQHITPVGDRFEIETIAHVGAGNYGSPGIDRQGNSEAGRQIQAAIIKHAKTHLS